MTFLKSLFTRLFEQRGPDHAYLSGSADVFELEKRIRHLERRGTLGLFAR